MSTSSVWWMFSGSAAGVPGTRAASRLRPAPPGLAGPLAQRQRQVAQGDLRAGGQHDAMVDRRAQFAHVARPGVFEEAVHRVGGQLS